MPNAQTCLLLTLCFYCTAPLADNLFSDNLLQPVMIEKEHSGWNFITKFGYNEGSGEIANDGYRLEIPRVSYQQAYGDRFFFRATAPYVYVNNDDYKKATIGDPSFFTTIKAGKQSTFTIGVTEPAANRAIEPDVVRFMGFYSANHTFNALTLTWQLGTEIPDRYAQEGQDDILSFGLGIAGKHWSSSIIRKQVVDGEWWDITQPLDSKLNRTNLTVLWNKRVNQKWGQELNFMSGLQFADATQWWLGLQFYPRQK